MRRVELLLLLSFLLFVQGYLLGNLLPAIMAYALVIYITYIRAGFRPSVLASRHLSESMQEGRRETSRLVVKNAGEADVRITVKEKLPPGFSAETPEFILRRGEDREVRYAVIPARGSYEIRGPMLDVQDMRGLFFRNFEVDSVVRVDVYPSLERIREEAMAEENIRLAEVLKESLFGIQAPEILFLRRFQEGDETRYIDWKATARLGELIVKEFMREDEGEIYIILDAGKEMRKGIKSSKIDYASTLALVLAHALKKHRVGLVVHDDYGVLHKIDPSRSPDRIERMARVLTVPPAVAELLSVKVPDAESHRLSDAGRRFMRNILPLVRGRRGAHSGLSEAAAIPPTGSFLIFITDITSHTGELARLLAELRSRHRVLLVTPNPILFYDESKLTRDKILWLYRRYVERERLIKRLNSIVPTVDVGPSDLAEVLRKVAE